MGAKRTKVVFYVVDVVNKEFLTWIRADGIGADPVFSWEVLGKSAPDPQEVLQFTNPDDASAVANFLTWFYKTQFVVRVMQLSE